MAIVDKNFNVTFDEDDFDAAWSNSPLIVEQNPEEHRMCFICKHYMIRELSVDKSGDESAWMVELINAKKPQFYQENFIAVHSNCAEYRPKMDCRKVLKRIKSVLWKMEEN